MKGIIESTNINLLTSLVKRKRIPANLLLYAPKMGKMEKEDFVNPYGKLPDDMQEKIDIYLEQPPTSVILTGEDSNIKDLMAVSILLFYASKGRKVQYYSEPNMEELKPAWATAFMRLGLLYGPYNSKKISTRLAGIITSGQIFVLGCESVDSISELLQPSMFNLLLGNSIEIATVSPEVGHIRI